MERLCSISEFARLCNVKKETLIFYDRSGVFEPQYRNKDTGYRYYSLDSIGVFVAITTLRNCGMSLKRIKEFMTNRSVQSLGLLFTEQLDVIEKEILKLKQIQSFVKEKCRLLYSDITTDEVYEEKWEEIPIISSYVSDTREQSTDDEMDISEGMVKHIQMREKLGISSFYVPDIILKREDVCSGIFNRAKGYFTKAPSFQSDFYNEVIPGGNYLSICFTGHWKRSAECYGKLILFAESNNKLIASDFYEQTILDAFAVDRQDAYLYKLSVLVK